jgi:hypothetical protein
MAESLQESFQRLHALLPKADVTSTELLDIFWLGEQLQNAAGSAAIDTIATEERPLPHVDDDVRDPSHEEKGAKREKPAPPPAKPKTPGVPIHVSSNQPVTGAVSLPAEPLRVRGAPGLPESLRIARALRPLAKRVSSRHAMIFDETATAELMAEARVFDPVMRATSARWLDLGVVVDRSGAMELWDKPVAELRDLFERHRAFRNVRAWNMGNEDGKLTFCTLSRQPRDMSPTELADPTGSQLIVIVSDCVSDAWSDTRMAKVMEQWSRCGPVAIFQVMPPELWRRTALRHARETVVRAVAPGLPNRYVRDVSETYDETLARDTVIVPVTSLDSSSLSDWAQFIAATGGAYARAFAFRTQRSEAEAEDERQRAAQAAPLTDAERVNRFDRIATPDAKRLARVLASAQFPLKPPLLRVVQDTVIPGSPRSAIAEVVLGGLLKVSERAADPENTCYQFTSGEVVEHLLDRISASDMLRLIQEKVTAYMEHFPNVLDFQSLLPNPGAITTLRIAANQAPFASITTHALQRLGGTHAAIARRIDERLEIPLALYEHLQQRVEGREAFLVWLRGLRRFGLPLLIEASLIAAEEVTGRAGRSHRLLQARECVWTQSREAAIALDETLKEMSAELRATSGAIRLRDPVSLAAQAAVIAFESDERVGDATEHAVVKAVVAALDQGLAVDKLLDVLRERLGADRTLLPEPLQQKGRVIVVGPVEYRQPENIQQTAMHLGRRLASAGFHLVVGGWGGVDYLVTRAFVREAEMRGDDVAARITQVIESGQTADFTGLRPVEARSWAEEVIKDAAAVVVIGKPEIPVLERESRKRHIAIVPLLWTSSETAERGPRGGMFLEEQDVDSAADHRLMIDRAMTTLATYTDREVRKRWRGYTNAVYAIVARDRPGVAKHHGAPRLAAFVSGLEDDCPEMQPLSRKEALERLADAGPELAQWLVFDTFALSEVEEEQVPERDELVRRFAEIAHRTDPELLRAWLDRRWRQIGLLLPQREIGGLMPIARTIFPDPSALSAWTHGIAGVTPEECAFRMSLPSLVYRAAERYAAYKSDDRGELESVIGGLFRRHPPYEFVAQYADAPQPGARLIAYVLMQGQKPAYAIAASELARRIRDEAEHARRMRDARMLRQLVLATSVCSEDYDPPSLRIVARALSAAAERLAHDGNVFGGGRLQKQIATMLQQPAFKTAAEQNRMIDAYAGSIDTPSGHVPAELRHMGIRGDEIEHLFRTSGTRRRLLALALSAAIADASSLEVVRAALATPLSPDELRFAVAAAGVLAPRLTHGQLTTLLDVVHDSPDAADLAERLTLQRDAVDRIRHLPIAVIGNDPSAGDLRDFCRHLGEQLAARELGVIVAHPDFAEWLAEGYRRANRELQGFVVLRRITDPRPLREGLPYRDVDGDLRTLREQMLGQAHGVVVVGGRKGTFEEYDIARRRAIPVVAVAASGGAAGKVAESVSSRLEKKGMRRAILQALRQELKPALATAVAEAMAWAVVKEETKRAARAREQERAATLTHEQLAQKLRALLHPRDYVHLDEALALLRAAASPSSWSGDPVAINGARRYQKRVQRLAFIYSDDPFTAELIERSELAVCVLEAGAVASVDERTAIEAAAGHKRFGDASPQFLEHLLRIIGGAPAIPGGRRATMLTRLQEEIDRLRRN